MTKTNDQLINQSSGKVEFYTPPLITDASRLCLNGIDLDPASNSIANVNVGAKRFFTKEDDGLLRPWIADTVFMNHPFHRGWKACTDKCERLTCQKRGYHVYHDIPSNLDWITKLTSEYESGNFREGICITFANTSETWFRKLLKYPQCFPDGRIDYLNPDGTICKGVTKGSVITYLGPNPSKFKVFFNHIGDVKVKL